MKINTEKLRTALKELSPFAKSKITTSNMVKLETDVDLKLSAHSGDMCGTRVVPFNGEIATICLSLTQFLYSLGDTEDAVILQEDGAIIVKCGAKVSKLQTLDAAEFPQMPNPADFRLIGVNSVDLSSGIRAVHGFEHPEDARGAISCLKATGSPKSIECVATDGTSLAVWRGDLISGNFELVIPSAFCGPLADALASNDAQLAVSERGVYVIHEGGSFWCKLSEYKFPSTKIAMDEEGVEPLGTMETKALSRELSSCLMFTDPSKIPRIDVEFGPDGVHTMFNGSTSQLENRLSGEFKPYKASLNAATLLKCINSIGDRCEVKGGKKLILSSGWKKIYLGLLIDA